MSATELTELLAKLDPPLTIADVGVRGGVEEVWTRLLPHVRVFGFDADEEECARLGRGAPDQVTYVPLALGAQPGAAVLHITADPACSSLYPPDAATAGLYPALEVTREASRRTVIVDTLDDWAARQDVTTVSYLKLDAQGAELDVLRGAKRVLAGVCALRVEVELNPIYRGQPLFGDVDSFLRKHDFVLWRLANLCHYTTAGRHSDGDALHDTHVFAGAADDVSVVEFTAGSGRLFWADAYYVRRELAEGVRPNERASATRAACVLTAIGFGELASVCL